MTRQQVLALKWLSLLGAAILSIAIPVLLVSTGLDSELALTIFAPGAGLINPVHNIIPALIVTVVVDAVLYCLVTYAAVSLLVRVLRLQGPR